MELQCQCHVTREVGELIYLVMCELTRSAATFKVLFVNFMAIFKAEQHAEQVFCFLLKHISVSANTSLP